MNLSRSVVATAAIAILIAVSRLAQAQVERSGGEPNAALLEQIQQLTSQNASLEADNARLKQQLTDLTKQRDSLKSAAKSAQLHDRSDAAALAQSNAQQLLYAKDLKLYKDRMGDLIDKFRATIDQLRQAEIDRANEKQALARSERETKICVDRNHALIKLNEEVLSRWDKQSFWSRLAMADYFTKIARTRLDNLTDDYKSQAEAERVTEGSLKGAVAIRPPPAPGAPSAARRAAVPHAAPASSSGAKSSSSSAPGP